MRKYMHASEIYTPKKERYLRDQLYWLPGGKDREWECSGKGRNNWEERLRRLKMHGIVQNYADVLYIRFE